MTSSSIFSEIKPPKGKTGGKKENPLRVRLLKGAKRTISHHAIDHAQAGSE